MSMLSISGLKASPLCFGCMQFGGTADAKISQAMYESCLVKGVNFFDTAHTYTGGESERLLGRFVRNDREKQIIATKAAYTGGSDRANILQQFDKSRARLGTDVVDVLYLHRWDSQTPLEDTFDTLCHLQRDGLVRFIGVSNFAAWQVMKAQGVARAMGTEIDIIQPMYSLVKRQAEVELFPMALSEGISVASYSPLAAGLLTGKYEAGERGRLTSDTRYAARYGQEWMQDTASRFTALAAEMGVDPTTLAVAWTAYHPAVTAPIISARTPEQLAPSLAALELTLSDEDYARIENLSVRPPPATDRLEEA